MEGPPLSRQIVQAFQTGIIWARCDQSAWDGKPNFEYVILILPFDTIGEFCGRSTPRTKNLFECVWDTVKSVLQHCPTFSKPKNSPQWRFHRCSTSDLLGRTQSGLPMARSRREFVRINGRCWGAQGIFNYINPSRTQLRFR